LYVNSSGIVTTSTSSARYKENITSKLSAELNPERLYDLPIVEYNYKAECADKALTEGTQIGITAEDIEKYYPNALIRNKDGEAESWQDRILIPAMLKLIQNQKAEIDNLTKRIERLEKLIGGDEK
jgi:predicted type IV restriction endonuclease